MVKKLFLFVFILLQSLNIITAQEKRVITVAKDGSGDYTTITAALKSLPAFNYQRTVINIMNGVYIEKLRIEKDYITLRGESREKTIIEYSQLRSDWDANKDSIGPGVINIFSDDIVLENLTIKNTQPQIGPHAFSIYGFGTRTILLNCAVLSKGADTVSLWDHKEGMYYHSGCYFEGAVDFVCPRGWCFIKDSQFFEVKSTASLWHAGGEDINQKFVIRNSSFNGIDGWELGRHHYEAQFYLIDCKFAANMSSKPIYRVTYPKEPERDRPFNWGPRYYFYNCVKEGTQVDWIKNNLGTAAGKPSKDKITAAWTFDNKWDPEKTAGPRIVKHKIEGNSVIFFFDDKITVTGIPVIKTSRNLLLTYHSGGGSDTVRFTSDRSIKAPDLKGMKIINSGSMFASSASVNTRYVTLILK